MDRDRAIELLPEAYAEAIRLHEAGLDDSIPQRLGVPPEAVGPLLRLAVAKLTVLLDTDEGPRAERDSREGGPSRASGTPSRP